MTVGGLPHATHMARALELARRAKPSPNPRVGAVVVKNGVIVGEGFHERPGLPHAEVMALRAAGVEARDGDIYVTLEPCCHEGRTGPCTQALLSAGIRRAYVGIIDPDANVRGRSIALLRDNGIEVEVGVLGEECARLLEGYTVHRTEGRPLVRLKAAVSVDGAIATRSGDSKWISCAASRRRAHALRADADAVVVGIGTLLADDPLLTVRDAPGSTPLRVVVDTQLRTPQGSQLIASAADNAKVLIAHASDCPDAPRALQREHVETLSCRKDALGKLDLRDLLAKLADRGVLSVLVEGGAELSSGFVRAGLADRFSLFVAPKLLGSARSWIALPEIASVSDAVVMRFDGVTRIEDDLLLEGSFTRNPSRGG